jgi:hypothetical protein
MRRMTASAARAAQLSPDVLPWSLEQCPIDPVAQLAVLPPESIDVRETSDRPTA